MLFVRSVGMICKLFSTIRFAVIITAALSVFFLRPGYAVDEKPPAEKHDNKRLLVIPFPFFNDTVGSGVGVAAIAEGYIQKQVLTVASGLYSAGGTYLTFLYMRDYQLPWIKRIFVSPRASYGELQDISFYKGYNPDFPNERAGSNDSSEDNFIEADGSDYWLDLNIKYLLPIGHGKDNILSTIKLKDGVLVSGQTGGEHWNPLKSGRTYFELEPFFRDQDLDDEEGTVQKTAGIEVALTYDNTDFPYNPSTGNYLRMFFDRDWGALDSSAPWSVWGGEYSQYFSLGSSEHSRQRLIAFNFWSVDCPTWESSHTEDGEVVFHRPPSYKGANLGGLWRLRGYPATRFNDSAGIYYGLEYRQMLSWNPLKDFTMKGRLDVDWFQFVGFGELGRVAPEWDFDELHEDMKWSVGVGLRSYINNLIVRFDVAASDEDVIAQLFIGQPWPKR